MNGVKKENKISNELEAAKIAAASLIEVAKITSTSVIKSTYITTIGKIIITTVPTILVFLSKTHLVEIIKKIITMFSSH